MIHWRWRHETEPPEPTAVVGIGSAARRLFTAVRNLAPRQREALRATANQDVLVVTGEALPWASGVLYAAPRAEAPSVWLPTTERPDIALELLERALRRRYDQVPLLLLREPAQVVPLHRLLPANDALLARIEALWNR